MHCDAAANATTGVVSDNFFCLEGNVFDNKKQKTKYFNTPKKWVLCVAVLTTNQKISYVDKITKHKTSQTTACRESQYADTPKSQAATSASTRCGSITYGSILMAGEWAQR